MKSQNFKCNFGRSPQPFQIQVDPEFIDYTKKKVELTRFAEDVEQPDFTDGYVSVEQNISYPRLFQGKLLFKYILGAAVTP